MLGLPAGRDIAEDQYSAYNSAPAIANRRAAVIDRALSAITGDQQSVICQSYHDAFAQRPIDRVLHYLAGLFVDDPKDTGDS
jgi:hypothetical protein